MAPLWKPMGRIRGLPLLTKPVNNNLALRARLFWPQDLFLFIMLNEVPFVLLLSFLPPPTQTIPHPIASLFCSSLSSIFNFPFSNSFTKLNECKTVENTELKFYGLLCKRPHLDFLFLSKSFSFLLNVYFLQDSNLYCLIWGYMNSSVVNAITFSK